VPRVALSTNTNSAQDSFASWGGPHRGRGDPSTPVLLLVAACVVILACLTFVASLLNLSGAPQPVQNANCSADADPQLASPAQQRRTPNAQQTQTRQQQRQSPQMPSGSRLLEAAGTPLIWPSTPSGDDRPFCADLVEREAKGTTYAIDGTIEPHPQAGEIAAIRNDSTDAVVGRIHITEDATGSGIMVELAPRSPIAFIDTSCAVVAEGRTKSASSRDAKIISATAKMEIDPLRPPFGIVKAMGHKTFALYRAGEPYLTLNVDSTKGQFAHMLDKSGKPIAEIKTIVSGKPYMVHAHCGADVGLVWCMLISALKLM